MRNIESVEEIERKGKRNKVILGVTIIGLMVLSTLGFAVLQGFGTVEDNSGEINYNGLKFIRNQNGYWEANTQQGVKLTTFYNPEETNEANLSIQAGINDFYNKPLFFVSDNYEAMNELVRNIGVLSNRFQEVCLKGEKCEFDYIEKTCDDNIIIIREMNETKTYKEGNCIFIESPRNQHLLISDKLIFRVYGIQ